MNMRNDGSEACARGVSHVASQTNKDQSQKETPIKSNYRKDNEMQTKIAPKLLMASVATLSPSVPGWASKKFLAALKNNNVATFSANAARGLLERR